MTPLALAAVVALAAWLAMPARVARARAAPAPTRSVPRPADDQRRRRWWWAAFAGAGAWAFVSGPLGPLAGAAAATVVLVVLGRAETPAQRARRFRLRAELPHVVGLLAAAVRAGLPPADAVALVCTALPGPAADALVKLPAHLTWGMDPGEVWGSLEADAALAPLGRTMARSARTGEPVAAALERLAAELSSSASAETEDAARRVGVRAAVPLGLCLLPSFLLLGIVPLVAGLAGGLVEGLGR